MEGHVNEIHTPHEHDEGAGTEGIDWPENALNDHIANMFALNKDLSSAPNSWTHRL